MAEEITRAEKGALIVADEQGKKILYPDTKTDQVFNEDGTTLEQDLTGIKENLDKKIGFANFSTSGRLTFDTTEYTAPTDGYLLVCRRASKMQLNEIQINGLLACNWITFASTEKYSTSGLIPMKKGDVATLLFDTTGATGGVNTLRYFYTCS